MTKPKPRPTTSPTSSPVPLPAPAEELFDFATALDKLLEGKKLTKKEWNNPKTYIFLGETDNILKIQWSGYALPSPLWLSRGDIMGTDWMEVKNG